MGSTDVWRPLRSLLLLSSGSGADSSTLPSCNVFLVTNGHMTEEQPTLQAIRRAVHTTRVFTFGVSNIIYLHVTDIFYLFVPRVNNKSTYSQEFIIYILRRVSYSHIPLWKGSYDITTRCCGL